MKYLTKLSIALVAIALHMFLVSKAKKSLAIGCDTYYRVTGEIAGCSDTSTEDARELWLEKYSFCLQQQLARDIYIYKEKVAVYYSELDKNPAADISFDRIAVEESEGITQSISQSQSTVSIEEDFCNE